MIGTTLEEIHFRGDCASAEALLGGLLLDESGETAARELPGILGIVRGEDFLDGDHRTIFDAIKALFMAGQPVTPAAVAALIGHDRHFWFQGMKLPIAERLIALAAVASNLGWYALELANSRRMREAA